MNTKSVNLIQLLNMAMTPTPGQVDTVNFNALKKFLAELVYALKLDGHEIVGSESRSHVEPRSDSVSTSSELDTRLRLVEDKLAGVQSIPATVTESRSEHDMMQRTRNLRKSSLNNGGPVVELWNYTQLNKRVESTEQGVTKLTLLIQDFISDLNEIRDHLDRNDQEIKQIGSSLNNITSKLDSLDQSIISMEQMKHKLDELSTKVEDFSSQIGSVGQVHMPQDLMDEIKKIRMDVEELKSNVAMGVGKSSNLETMIANISQEISQTKFTLSQCLKIAQTNKEELKRVNTTLSSLAETKADKDKVSSDLSRKADKLELGFKVDKEEYDTSVSKFTADIQDASNRASDLNQELQNTKETTKQELERKLDKSELDEFKSYMEDRLKKIKSSKQLETTVESKEDAAGFRKPLKFNCISCDRPLDILPNQNPVPSLPADKGLRANPTSRSYTTYELDQIRQYQKIQYLNENSSSSGGGVELMTKLRQCGGVHTMTLPSRRFTRTQYPIDNEIPAHNTPVVPDHIEYSKNEASVTGNDGRIYRGRINSTLLAVEMKNPVRYSLAKQLSHVELKKEA